VALSPLDISASALTAERLRMDVIASNIANASTTRARLVNGTWQPYTRKLVVFEPRTPFASILGRALSRQTEVGAGVQVSRIVDDPTPPRLVYDPAHPDAGPDGYVRLPNVDIVKEMADLIAATRAYEANVAAFQAGKAMLTKALELGR
jgi:flagellar basal-body rod protein FlgC